MALSRELQILITAKDEASKKLGSIGSALGTTFKVAGAMAVVAGTAITAFGVSSVKAFAESEAEMSVFYATMKSIKGVTPQVTNELEKAGQAVTKFGFSDETATVALGKFYQRTKDVTESTKLLALSTDLARAKNIDLETSSKMVTMVLSGNARALKEYGIVLDESKTPMEALAELQTMVAGQTEMFANTLTGKMQRLSETFGNFKESVGSALAQFGVGGILDYITDKLEQMSEIDFGDLFAGWRNNIVAFGVQFEKLTGMFTMFQGVGMVLVDFFNTYLKPAWDSLVQTVVDNKDMLLTLVGYFGKFLAVIGGGALIAGMTALVMVFQAIELAIKGVKWFIESLSLAFQDFANWIDNVISKLKEFGSMVKESGIGKFASNVKGGAGIVSDWVKSKFVDDAVISPNGDIISTHPDDYLIATKTPQTLGGSGSTVNMSGNVFLSEDVAEMIGDSIINRLALNTKLS